MPKLLRAKNMEECIACGSCMLACARSRYRTLSVDTSAIRVRTAGGFRSSMIADFCLGCEEPACAAVCASGALQPRPGGGVILKRDQCLGCGQCAEACTVRGIHYDSDLGYPVVCSHCGACTRYCPHGCLVLEDVDAT
jgi:anaerobic carbon-monoxide dehydrogenase iron sulfur subunit